MAGIGDNVATVCATRLIDLAMKELPYFCCYNSYVEGFEKEKGRLIASMESVHQEIKVAKKRNETEINPTVQEWLKEGDDIIKMDTKPKKWFGLCINCFSNYSRAKELESVTKEIPMLIDKVKNFPQVARVSGPPGMEFHSQNFIHFESRKSKFEELKKELEDDNNYMIGLQGMGGTGKSTMAIEVGKQVGGSKPFDKVIFIVVSQPADDKKIRDGIAEHLELQLKEEEQSKHPEQLWTRIANVGKVLIILDDVWKELNLKNIGIQPGFHHKGCCRVLLTTRDLGVCTKMECQKTIQLEVLSDEDATNLFLSHASTWGNDCSDNLKVMALDIVNECGKLPVAIVAIAKSLRNEPLEEWHDTLRELKNPEPLMHEIVDENTMKVYNSLRLSYDYLNDEKAQDFFILCSLFPEDYEIAIELLGRIAIGLGLFGDVDKYYKGRRQVRLVKKKLIDSSLLLNVGDKCVKMHDMIREVALNIAKQVIQVLMYSKTKLKDNIKYSSRIINDFSNPINDSNLEVLLVWVNENDSLIVPEAFLRGMERLRVLILNSKIKFGRTSALSLPKSIQSLKNIRTLSLTNWELGDIYVLRNLEELQAIELTNCSVTQLPDEVSELKKLRFLCLISCLIKRNNPFDVIGRCSQLEELHYVSNYDNILKDGKEVPQITSLPNYQMFHIDGSHDSTSQSQLNISTKTCFKPAKLKGIFSKETFKALIARAEILELGEDSGTGCKNLIPDVISIEDGAMKDLVRLSLRSWSEMQCLINTNRFQHGTTIFSKLVELRLYKMDVGELCCGRYPSNFLKQLEKLELMECMKLEGTLLRDKLDLGNLKSVKLRLCSMKCLFHPSTAQSLKQLETLNIKKCSMLKYIIKDEGTVEEKVDDPEPNQRRHDSMFPNLKSLKVRSCEELEFLLPINSCEDLILERVDIEECGNLQYIFGQYPEERDLYEMRKEIILSSLIEFRMSKVPNFVSIYPECHLPKPFEVQQSSPPIGEDENRSNSLSRGCCFLPKSRASSLRRPSASKSTLSNHTQALKGRYVADKAHGLFTPPLFPYNLRKMSINGFSELTSLFTLSIASSLKLLETLDIGSCDALEHIVTDEGLGHHDPIFPNLRQVDVDGCSHLEFIFPAFYSTHLKHLESVSIRKAENLKHAFGVCHPERKQNNDQIQLNLPALKELRLHDVPNMLSICPENYYVKAVSLEDVSLEKCAQHPIQTVVGLLVDVRKTQGRSRTKASKDKYYPNTAHGYVTQPLYQCKLREITISGYSGLTSLFTLSIASSLSKLEKLKVKECDALEYIVADERQQGDDHMNVRSVFPNLQEVFVQSCSHLQSVFPAFYSTDFKHLERMSIRNAEKLKYVFGKCHSDRNQKVQIELNLPSLKNLLLYVVPDVVSICTENYYVKALSLTYIGLEECPQVPIKAFTDFSIGGQKRQEDLALRKATGMCLCNLKHVFLENFDMDSIYDHRRLQIASPVSSSLETMTLRQFSELREICVGPKNYLSFQNLSALKIEGCKQLKVIFSASISRSLPELKSLKVSDCEELESIIEDEEDEQNPMDSHQLCFPELRRIRVKHCKRLKALFTISTSSMLPNLLYLNIEDADELRQAFGTTQELIMRDVLPKLIAIRLVNLKSFHTICPGIDFQTLKIRLVRDCPSISLTSANASYEELIEFCGSLRMNFLRDDCIYASDIWDWAFERQSEESKETNEKDGSVAEQKDSSPKLANSEEASNEVVEKDSTIHKQNSSSPNLTESTKTGANEIVEEQLSISDVVATATPLSNSEMTIKETVEPSVQEDSKLDEASKENQFTNSELKNASPAPFVIPSENESPDDYLVHKEVKSKRIILDQQALPKTGPDMHSNDPLNNIEAILREGPSLEKYDKASSSIENPYSLTSTKELHGKESMCDRQIVGESRIPNKAPQRVEEPTNECSSKERSNEMAVAIPTAITEMGSPLPQIATSATLKQFGSSKSNIKTQTEIGFNQVETSTEKETQFDQGNPQQFEEDDLMRLLQIVEDGDNMEVHIPYVSKIAALEDDKEVTKALADLEAPLKMSLNEIASSEENIFRLENALNILSSHCSEDAPPSHGLKATFDSLQQEIQTILSAFKQAYATIDTFTKLEQKEKFIIEEGSQRKEAALALLSGICNTKSFLAEAQLKEAELKEQISKLHDELYSKEKEIEECEIKLRSLQDQKKESVADTIRFVREFEIVKRERSHMVKDQIKATQQLEKMDVKWSSCLSNLKKTILLLGVHLQQRV